MTFTITDRRHHGGDAPTPPPPETHYGVSRIVSGGQTGADRGALDAAIDMGIPHGGWCPLGRAAEDGVVPLGYTLRETTSTHYGQRTALNVRDSHGTLMVSFAAEQQAMTGGTKFTRDVAKKQRKPLLHVQLHAGHVHDISAATLAAIRAWLKRTNVRTLNVAGPRESKEPGIQEATREFVTLLLTEDE